MTKELKGRHVLIIALCAFGVIIVANLTMLFSATGSFPGLVVKNSYVASQGWNARTANQQALGWSQSVQYTNGALEVVIRDSSGKPLSDAEVEVVIGRPASDTEDEVFEVSGTSPWRLTRELGPGQWRVEIRSTGDRDYRTTTSLFVSE